MHAAAQARVHWLRAALSVLPTGSRRRTWNGLSCARRHKLWCLPCRHRSSPGRDSSSRRRIGWLSPRRHSSRLSRIETSVSKPWHRERGASKNCTCSRRCIMQHSFLFVQQECCTARACVAGVRLLNVLSAASWFRAGGRERAWTGAGVLFLWLSYGLRCARAWAFGVVAGSRDAPIFRWALASSPGPPHCSSGGTVDNWTRSCLRSLWDDWQGIA